MSSTTPSPLGEGRSLEKRDGHWVYARRDVCVWNA